MAESQSDRFTRWGVVASGEGGGRIASQFFVRSENPGIQDRILVMNTNRSDLRNTIERIESRIDSESEDIWGDFALEFGQEFGGAGNFFPTGQAAASSDLPHIMRSINNRMGGSDALLHIATLGGGTGNGSIPYVIDQFKNGNAEEHQSWMGRAIHATLAIWPFEYEPPQRHFNAVCGLSRLLRNRDGSQNADMVIIADNSHISENGGENDFDAINTWLISAIDLMIGAGRRTRGVIDIQDYVTIPSQIGAYHFTPAVATGYDGDMFELDYIFDQAAENAFAPLDISTSRVVYAVVRVPQRMLDDGSVTEPEVNSAFRDWKESKGIENAAGMVTLTPTDERGSEIDVMMMFGGFDLDPLLDRSWDSYEEYKDRLQSGRILENSELAQSDLQRIEDNLTEYRDLNRGQ